MLSCGGPVAEPAAFPVEVAYATAARQEVVVLSVAPGVTARQAVRLSGLERVFPEIDPERCSIGIFGRVVRDDELLREGDRVEIYRPLPNDPREARRDRVVAERPRRAR